MAAPSFSSFPPSFASFPDLDPGPSSRASPPPTSKDKERKRHKKSRGGEDRESGREQKKKSKHDKHESRRDRRDSRRSSLSRSPPRQKHDRYEMSEDERRKLEEDRKHRRDYVEKPDAKEGLVYFTDRRGDPQILQYGGLYAGDVPKYYLVGRGRKVLGMSPELSVVYRGRGGLEVAPFGRRKMPALTDAGTHRRLAAAPTRRLLASSEDKYKFREVDGFLRISSGRPPKDDQSYRDIESSKYDQDSDYSEHSEDDMSSGDDSDTTPMTALQATLKDLEEKLSKDPRHTPTWSSLLSHTLSTVPSITRNAAKARAEIALSVLSRALSAHPDNKRSKTLRLKYLKAGEELWQAEKLRDEWEDAVKVDDVEIWIAWLDWRLRRSSDILENISRDSARVSRALATRGNEIGQVRVLWRAAVALRDAGYVERANALFQAEAEWIYAAPKHILNRTVDDQLNALEEFWDSEVLRFGEPDAKGWAAWDAASCKDEGAPRASRPSGTDVQHADPYSKWAASEELADRTHILSTRSDDADESTDPYATVLLSDIRPLLVPLHTHRAKDIFRHAWLAFAGLHVPGFLESLSEHPEDNTDDRWAYSHLVSPLHLNAVFPSDARVRRITADAQAGVLVGREREYSSGFGPVKHWGYGTIGPFDIFGHNTWTMWSSEDVQDTNVELVREIFRQCRLPGEDSAWDTLHLAFASALNIKSALKASKSMLSTSRDSLAHWATHARMECLRSRFDDARKVYHTVLLANSSTARAGEGMMWWDWAQMEWLARNDDAAVQVILRSSKVPGSGGLAVLRAKRHFETLLSQQPLPESWKEQVHWIQLAALLELLTSSPQAALSLFESRLGDVVPGTAAHESLTVASICMLYNHAIVLKNPTPPALLRERAERAIEIYPNNTAIFGIFLEAEKGQGIWGKVRAALGETAADGTGKEKGVARRVAEVWVAGWEKGRWEAEIERTRSGLMAAVESDRTRGSAVLWKLFIAFEIRVGQLERAKKLLFRAVGECPLVKELYLLAFGPLREVFSARELHQWADTMAERGIRMRVGLDEMAGEWADNRREDGWSSGEAEDEIEERARELRRLRPY